MKLNMNTIVNTMVGVLIATLVWEMFLGKMLIKDSYEYDGYEMDEEDMM